MNIKKILKSSAAEALPRDEVKKNIKRDLGYEEAAGGAVDAGGGTLAVRRNRTLIIAACAVALAIIIAVGVLISSLFGGRPAGNFADEDKFSKITDSESFYAYGAASVGAVISSRSGMEELSAPAPLKVASSAYLQRSGSAPYDMDTVNSYLALVEGLLSEGDITGTAIDGNGYECGMAVRYYDLLGNAVTYYMYYNRHLKGEEYDDEVEKYYSIEGILIVDGVEYPVEGDFNSESEEDESENELYFKAYHPYDSDSFIEVSRESEEEWEDGEQKTEYEYVYSLYRGGERVERTVVEYEKEGGELELVMKIERGDEREELKFNDETEDGERVIEVSGNIGGQQADFKIYVREGKYHYVFSDGSSSDYDRGRNHWD